MSTSEKHLLQGIISTRARKRQKQVFRRTPFSRVSAVVEKYGLDETFIRDLERSMEHDGSVEKLSTVEKESMDLPLFSLVSEKTYRLTEAILDIVDNPYVQFANSPEELLLACRLYQQNARLDEHQLSSLHFCVLLSKEYANGSKRA
ncbi:MAG: hypothetical protein JRJ12_02190 [Deltaproteobacteria bacterium]|nr:hypothetical protein [Deltaproteobacteria bacterium]MBW2070082.1 hypothetical protein [Deltaproteobacteria bacterium]